MLETLTAGSAMLGIKFILQSWAAGIRFLWKEFNVCKEANGDSTMRKVETCYWPYAFNETFLEIL